MSNFSSYLPMVRHINPLKVRLVAAQKEHLNCRCIVLVSVNIFLFYYILQCRTYPGLVNNSMCEASLVVVVHCSVVHNIILN